MSVQHHPHRAPNLHGRRRIRGFHDAAFKNRCMVRNPCAIDPKTAIRRNHADVPRLRTRCAQERQPKTNDLQFTHKASHGSEFSTHPPKIVWLPIAHVGYGVIPCEDVLLDSTTGHTELAGGPPSAPMPSVPPLRRRLLIGVVLLALYLAIVFLLPRPEAVKPAGWRLLGIFVATVGALILRPIPGGAAVLIAVTLASIFGGLTIHQALGGYGDPTVWLVMAALFIFHA